MRLYPQLPDRLLRTLAADGITFLLLLIFALVGLKVHDAVDKLAVLGQGVEQTGGAVHKGFNAAADAVDGLPVVGGDVADALRDAGKSSGGEVEGLGQSGEDSVHKLANLLGLVTFLLPAAVLLYRYLPWRVGLIRRLTDASRVVGDHASIERRRLVAMRAAFSLPYGHLLAYTRDPLGDLAAERYEPLVAAELADAGLRPRF